MLAILGQRETYGYEIVQALHGYGFGSVSEGTIYPLCSDWRRRDGFPPGLWTRTWDRGGNTIPPTDQGRRELAQFRASFREMTAAVSGCRDLERRR